MRTSRTGISPAERRQLAAPGPAGNSSETGFTLLELVVVLAIVAGVMALVFPRVGGALESLRLRSAGRMLSSTVFGLRQEAVTTRSTYRMIFDLKKGTVQVARVTGDGEVQVLRQESLPSGISFSDVETVKQGKVQSGEASCDFFPGGYVEETTIHLSGGGKREQTLFIKPFALGVEVRDGYEEQEKRAY